MPNKPNFDTKSVIPDEIRAKLTASVQENWDELLQAMIELASGIWYESREMDKDNTIKNVRVYRMKPDKDVAKYLMDQVIGKPKESMNIEGKVSLVADESLT